MQTILGAGGAIGTTLASELKKYTDNIRLVSRSPKAVNPDDEVFAADLTDAQQTSAAIAGSEVVYLVVGLPYSSKVWKNLWPRVMKNVIDGCIEQQAKLVFFDNIYMYDPGKLDGMTEETPHLPSSKKGKVRAEILKMLFREVEAGNLQALVARAPDFLGTHNSIPVEIGLKYMLQGKIPMWQVDAEKKHSLIYDKDAARATALLGNTPTAYNQSWHLPPLQPAYTGKEWIRLFAEAADTEAKYRIMPRWLMQLMGLAIKPVGEMREMAYQYDRNYVFNSNKFEQAFPDFQSTDPKTAVNQVIIELKSKN